MFEATIWIVFICTSLLIFIKLIRKIIKASFDLFNNTIEYKVIIDEEDSEDMPCSLNHGRHGERRPRAGAGSFSAGTSSPYPGSSRSDPSLHGSSWARSWDDTRPGLCAFDPPPQMKVGRSEIVAVRVSPQDPEDFEAMARMIKTLHRPDVARIEQVEVGRLMRARLLGEPDAFVITPLNSEDQLLELTKIARWDFSVQPKKSGQRWLQLVITVRVPVDGRVELRDLPELKRVIMVEVAPLESLKQFASKRGEFVADKMLIPFIVFIMTALGFTAWLTGWVGGGKTDPVPPPAASSKGQTTVPPPTSSQTSPAP